MDFSKTLKSVEDAVYEVMVWILLLPKTLFRVLFQPKWAMDYVLEEFDPKKDADKRFDDYFSPVLLWLMVTVIPFSLILVFSGEIKADESVISKAVSNENFFKAALYMMVVPFVYIVSIEMKNKQPIKRSTLKRARGPQTDGRVVLRAEQLIQRLDRPRHQGLDASHAGLEGQATDGAAGIACAHAEHPDVILLDVLMPRMDGLAVCRQLRTDPALRDTPIILLTALRDPGVVAKGAKVGATTTVHKPSHPAAIVDLLGTVLRRRTGPAHRGG